MRNLKRLGGDGMRLRCLASLGMTYTAFRPLTPRIKYGVSSESVEGNERESMGGLRQRVLPQHLLILYFGPQLLSVKPQPYRLVNVLLGRRVVSEAGVSLGPVDVELANLR